SLGVECEEVAVRFAAQDQASGGCRRSAATTDTVGRFGLPRDLVGFNIDRGEGTCHRRPDRCSLAPAGVALSVGVLGAVAKERAGSYRARDIQITSIGT